MKEVPLSDEKSGNILSGEFAKQYPLHILIAEDNLINQKLIRHILTKMGYDTEIAQNGHEVLEKMKIKPYDVILMDIQMPEMDGLEATGIIRKQQIQQPYIIAMTANAMPEDREICIQAGMDEYIAKPMKLDELNAILKKAYPIVKERA